MNFFTALSQITNYGKNKGDNALPRFKHLNDIIANTMTSYAVSPVSGSLNKNASNSRQVLTAPLVSTIYNVAIDRNVTKLLEVGKKINIADLNVNDFGFTIDNVRLTLGVGADKYDGGDLELYLGDTLIGKVKEGTLTAIKEGDSAEFISKLNDSYSYKVGSGSFSMVNGADITYNSLLNVRLSKPTDVFEGYIAITVFTTARAVDCGTYCDTCAGGTKGSKGLKCVSGKCQICSTSSFGASDVVAV